MAAPDGSISEFAKLDSLAQLSMSPETVKDLLLLLQAQIPLYEKEYGEIVTAYLKKQK